MFFHGFSHSSRKYGLLKTTTERMPSLLVRQVVIFFVFLYVKNVIRGKIVLIELVKYIKLAQKLSLGLSGVTHSQAELYVSVSSYHDFNGLINFSKKSLIQLS